MNLNQEDTFGQTKLVFGFILRVGFDGLEGLKADISECVRKHDAELLYQKVSFGFLKIVEEPFERKEV